MVRAPIVRLNRCRPAANAIRWAQIKMVMGLPISDALLSAPIGFVVLYLIGRELSGLATRRRK